MVAANAAIAAWGMGSCAARVACMCKALTIALGVAGVLIGVFALRVSKCMCTPCGIAMTGMVAGVPMACAKRAGVGCATGRWRIVGGSCMAGVAGVFLGAQRFEPGAGVPWSILLRASSNSPCPICDSANRNKCCGFLHVPLQLQHASPSDNRAAFSRGEYLCHAV